MAFNWRREPSNPYLPADGSMAQMAANSMAGYQPLTAMTPHGNGMNGYFSNDAIANQSQGFSVPNQQHGGMGQPELDGYGASLQAASDAAAQAQAREQQIADIQSQIKALQTRIAENQAKLKNWNGSDVANKIAALEARKFFSQDPTSIWRWKQDKDYATQLAEKQKETDNTAKANAMIEVANAVDNMVVDPSMDTPTANAMLSKLADYKTLLQKNGLPTKMVDDKIAEIKGDNKKVITETSETEDEVTYEGKDREQSESKASRLLGKKDASVQELENASKSNVSNDTKNKLLAKRDEVKAKNIQEEKDQKRENSLLGKGKFLTSEEIQFMEGRKDVKKHTDDYGNVWFIKRQL